jgi:uncharacterized protein (DUF488 family)
MTSFDLFSIGHSNLAADRFRELLQIGGVNAVADVRSVPWSRFFPWFSRKNLEAWLPHDGVTYLPCGDALGGRPGGDELYRDGIADYDAMAAQPRFCTGLDRLIGAAAHARVCLMCAEREPLDCHRCLLVARSLAGRGLAVGHILHNGTIEAHAATERRLLELEGQGDGCDLFATGQRERLAAAYRRRARAFAFRKKIPAPQNAAEKR